ncbi:uncharacterized protein LOC114521473 [Dendronephthya gigantea]|uniref:uncharacterized protein LOC114521473 n=1 Tax=Dendronephthya gigantea TaxID=151771 RepID=UPI00106B3A4F|nr:uncharacterized protein LOC114521473 [Dendronephthya gigantea]XP_028397739.1 uncharacterized protein LOC114521473 [Dendronephthya gigantea]
MANIQILVLVLMYCGLCHAAFCSDDELAGKCWDDKIIPMAIGAAVVAFILGISVILLAVALLCKAKRRHRTKVMVYRQPYRKTDSVKGGIRDNAGFESARQYHVKRPALRDDFEEPAYIMTRNAARPSKIPVADLAEDDMSESPSSSRMQWIPEEKKIRANVAGRSGIYQ